MFDISIDALTKPQRPKPAEAQPSEDLDAAFDELIAQGEAVTKRLWEVRHPYYCREGNYFARASETIQKYESWKDFIAEQGDADLDLNLVFRWDWSPRGEEDDEWDLLKLFYIKQRKGLYRYVEIAVSREDEPAIREWLKVRWEHMRSLWAPFSGLEESEE